MGRLFVIIFFLAPIVAEAQYAMPMDVNAQLMVTATMFTDLNSIDDGSLVTMDGHEMGDLFNMVRTPEATAMALNTTYSLDHSYNWSTSAWFDYIAYTPGGDDANTSSTTTIGVSTTKSVLNKMTVTGNFGYVMTDDGTDGDQEDPTMTISSTLTYWVF